MIQISTIFPPFKVTGFSNPDQVHASR